MNKRPNKQAYARRVALPSPFMPNGRKPPGASDAWAIVPASTAYSLSLRRDTVVSPPRNNRPSAEEQSSLR